jgi:transforming growth factor-beta-induced protein
LHSQRLRVVNFDTTYGETMKLKRNGLGHQFVLVAVGVFSALNLACGPQNEAADTDVENTAIQSDQQLLETEESDEMLLEQDSQKENAFEAQKKKPTIAAIAQSNSDFSILVAAAAKAGVVPLLDNPRVRLTVFAPTNAAFAALLKQLGITNGLDGLSQAQLLTILKYHVIAKPIDAAEAVAAARQNAKVKTLGGSLALSLDGAALKIDRTTTVVATDIFARNGVIHVIDSVLLPSLADVVVSNHRFEALKRALVKADANLVTVLDNDEGPKFTVFAPDNHAFANLVRALRGNDFGRDSGIRRLSSFRGDQLLPVLKYHVIAGAQVLAAQIPLNVTPVDTLGGKVRVLRTPNEVTVDKSTVTTGDILTSNGVIHVIDQVLLPSITDVVTTDSRFTSLAKAVVAAGAPLPAVLDDDAGIFTLFGPTNQGFASVVLPPNARLLDVLLYHAVPGAKVYANQARRLVMAKVDTALAGKKIEVNGRPQITVGDSTPVKAVVGDANIFTSNGVIHQIDKVLIP